MENKALNLELITFQYRHTGAAAKAYTLLSDLIAQNRSEALRKLLRDHKKDPIQTNDEVNKRDNVDYLLEYYAILELGRIANYFPEDLTPSLKAEIREILDNDYVKRYYMDFYPLALPQLLLEQIETDKVFYSDENNDQLAAYFEEFLMLTSIKRDEDVLQFLWFLDDGLTEGYSIHHLWNVLINKDKIKYKLGSDPNHTLNRALFGFIKYIQFLDDYAEFLKKLDQLRILQSACWHFHSYWFEHMQHKLGDIVTVALKNIRSAARITPKEELFADKNSYIDSEEDYNDWRASFGSLGLIERQIDYLTNAQMGQAIYDQMRQPQPAY